MPPGFQLVPHIFLRHALDQVNRRIDAHHGEYIEARNHLEDALTLLANCADIYARCDDTNRRLCNQAFFTKVYIDEDDKLRVEHQRPFEMLLDPKINGNALNWSRDSNKARTPANDSLGKGSSLVRRVGPEGLEPSTCGLTSHFDFRRRPGGRSWSGLSLHRSLRRRCHPSSLYTFRDVVSAWLGIAI
ncbi:hypothetical protein HGQ17_07600 [Nesterenkonia sp. MY13]|uniref:Uncharacterized protein n=1 Tax=Nesterenkonia sedimenti TaxID=1463632 RepID=A0A7X8TKV3_9MICC|nr:hypothetical protein [Nesterenkonia sedimenti]NLS09868.1 hypothetical protein [Nesterenkonia sedimenti]